MPARLWSSRIDQLRCRCGCQAPAEVEANLVKLATYLDIIQDGFWNLNIISGYRCAAQNAAAGGADQSRHILGDAVDLKVSRHGHYEDGRYLEGWIAALIHCGKLPEGGLGTYISKPYTCHWDFRGNKARWRNP